MRCNCSTTCRDTRILSPAMAAEWRDSLYFVIFLTNVTTAKYHFHRTSRVLVIWIKFIHFNCNASWWSKSSITAATKFSLSPYDYKANHPIGALHWSEVLATCPHMYIIGHSAFVGIAGTFILVPWYIQSGHCNSFEDQVPLKVVESWEDSRVPGQ